MAVINKLMTIQTQIKAPKNLYNKFGGYSYRNAEGILEAVKPYLKENGCALFVSDEMMQVGDRYYIKATATLIDVETGERVSTSALAREEENKKGMDASQLTGSTSSYARKYALNGLFLLDDTKDADTDEYAEQTRKAPAKPSENPSLVTLLQKCSADSINVTEIAKKYGYSNVHDMPEKWVKNAINNWDELKNKLKG